MHLLPDGEYWLCNILRFQENVIDIREQYSILPVSQTVKVTEELNYNHPACKDGYTPLTTDLLVDFKDRHQKAYNIKYSEEEILKHPKQVLIKPMASMELLKNQRNKYNNGVYGCSEKQVMQVGSVVYLVLVLRNFFKQSLRTRIYLSASSNLSNRFQTVFS